MAGLLHSLPFFGEESLGFLQSSCLIIRQICSSCGDSPLLIGEIRIGAIQIGRVDHKSLQRRDDVGQCIATYGFSGVGTPTRIRRGSLLWLFEHSGSVIAF